jgi:hypothetical protein
MFALTSIHTTNHDRLRLRLDHLDNVNHPNHSNHRTTPLERLPLTLVDDEGQQESQQPLLDALDGLEMALIAHHKTSRRVAYARESLEEALSELYAEKAVEGATLLEREACLLRLTSAERFELFEAEHAQAEAYLQVQRAELRLMRCQ